jgi:hypothetical protein
MKFAGRGLCFAVLLLALGVAGREVPELVSLTDDVSKDGELITWVEDAVPELKLISPSRRDPSSTLPAAYSGWHHPEHVVLLRALPVCVIPGSDLLHRLNLQRK